MINRTILTIILASFTLVSCSSEKKSPEELINETPEAIEETSSYDISSSFKRRGWHENIIERLYKEAIEKNKEVAIIDESIHVANNMFIDSLEEYDKYININEEYWETANSYIARISDTVVRKSIKRIFDKAELNYCDSKKDLISLNDKITLEKERFDNQVLLLKLAVTLPMIQNYQNNEKPDSTKLKKIINGFQKVSNEIDNYNELKSH